MDRMDVGTVLFSATRRRFDCITVVVSIFFLVPDWTHENQRLFVGAHFAYKAQSGARLTYLVKGA
jgi:hypothetical protein